MVLSGRPTACRCFLDCGYLPSVTLQSLLMGTNGSQGNRILVLHLPSDWSSDFRSTVLNCVFERLEMCVTSTFTCCDLLLQVGATVQVKRPDSTQLLEAIVNRINDCSIYTVGKWRFGFFLPVSLGIIWN